MRKCWEILPENRPSFNELYRITSTYIERMAGYLELGFNPFSGKDGVTCMEQNENDEVAIEEAPEQDEMCELHDTVINTPEY